MSHISDDGEKQAVVSTVSGPDVGTPNLRFELLGSQLKTAHALEVNVARLVREAGLERCGFLTLTVGRVENGTFRQVWESDEASRRINNLSRRVLSALFSRWVIVTERHKSGAIHFHIVGALRAEEDIRTGFDWEAVAGGHYGSASPYLRGLWEWLRETLPGYGFGRAELTPIRSCAEGISRYVAKYIEKNLFNRLAEDKGKKLVRYGGWGGRHCRSNDICWTSERAIEWRRNAETIARAVGFPAGQAGRLEVHKGFGPRWAFRLSRVMSEGAHALSRRLHQSDWEELVVSHARSELIYPEWDRWDSLDAWEEWAEDVAAVALAVEIPSWVQMEMELRKRA